MSIATCRYCAGKGTVRRPIRGPLPCAHPPFEVRDLVFIRPTEIHNGGTSPTAPFEGRALRVESLRLEMVKPAFFGGAPVRKWAVTLRALGGGPAPEGEWDAVWFERTVVLSFALDRADIGGLAELRRLWRAAHLGAPEAWSPCDRTLPALLRRTTTLVLSLWEDEPDAWVSTVLENLAEWKGSIPRTGEVLRLRVRMAESVAVRLVRMASTLGIPLDHLAIAGLMQQIGVLYMDGPEPEALRPELRLAPPPPSALKFYREEELPPPPVLPEPSAPIEESSPAPPPLMVEADLPAAPPQPAPPPIPRPGSTAQQVLACRPLRPPGR